MVSKLSKNHFKFEGKVALVTGGAQGMGEEVCHEFCRQGAKIAMADRNPEKGTKVVNELKKLGYEAIFIETEATDYTSVEKCVQNTLKAFNTIDILINCIGYNKFFPIEETTNEFFDMIIKTNLYSAWYFCKAVMPEMIKKKKGKIVNIGSGAGIQGIPKALAYVTAKHGLGGLTKALAVDLGSYNINVNCIAPGAVFTPLLYEAGGEAYIKKTLEEYPIPRLGETTDIAKAALFLASPDSDWITGTIIPVDGGLTSCIRAHHHE